MYRPERLVTSCRRVLAAEIALPSNASRLDDERTVFKLVTPTFIHPTRRVSSRLERLPAIPDELKTDEGEGAGSRPDTHVDPLRVSLRARLRTVRSQRAGESAGGGCRYPKLA